jgi:hypothetical protein
LLLRAGELQELHELRPFQGSAGICDFLQSTLEQEVAANREGAPRNEPVSRAVTALRVVKAENSTLPDRLIQQCAAALTEVDGFCLSNDARLAISRCARLESLSLGSWYRFPRTALLGLSQLHTLRGASFCDVPAAAIAAALPRLHTLHLNHVGTGFDSSVAAFYDTLLPRLRSFHMEGMWPNTSDDADTSDVPPLPLLEDLKWIHGATHLPRPLTAARPSTLYTCEAILGEWVKAADDASPDSPFVMSPLARVRTLTLRPRRPSAPATLARLLRAAPQLRHFAFNFYGRDHALRVFSQPLTPEPAFAEVVDSGLRHVAITTEHPLGLPVAGDCGVRLRQRHFPHLRRFSVEDAEYPVWAP